MVLIVYRSPSTAAPIRLLRCCGTKVTVFPWRRLILAHPCFGKNSPGGTPLFFHLATPGFNQNKYIILYRLHIHSTRPGSTWRLYGVIATPHTELPARRCDARSNVVLLPMAEQKESYSINLSHISPSLPSLDCIRLISSRIIH